MWFNQNMDKGVEEPKIELWIDDKDKNRLYGEMIYVYR